MSTYRDDLEAAQARADAASAEAERLRKEVEKLKKPRTKDDAPEVPIPERFDVNRTADELTVTWRWFRGYHVFLLLFAIAWNAFLVLWYSGPMSGQMGLIVKLFPIAHVAIGLALTYVVLTGFFNRTTISARHGRLQVKHGPLPWRGNHRIAGVDLRQLFVTERTDHHTSKNGTRSTIKSWDLCALMETGKELTLLKRLETQPQAVYLERVFEEQLGIEDRPVAGEVGKA